MIFAKQVVFAQFVINKSLMIPGSIITLNNDTITGNIKIRSEVEMQFRIEFYSETTTKIIYKPQLIKGYYLIQNNDTSCYESFKYWKPFYFLNRNFFLRKITNGNISLYLYKEEGLDISFFTKTVHYYYFIKKDGKWINTKPITANNFKKQLKVLFKDCEPLVKELKNSKLFIDELPVLIDRYNRLCYN